MKKVILIIMILVLTPLSAYCGDEEIDILFKANLVGIRYVFEKEALEIAKKVCEEEGWEWKDVSSSIENGKWQIRTNTSEDGSNAVIYVDTSTGEVLEKHFNKTSPDSMLTIRAAA